MMWISSSFKVQTLSGVYSCWHSGVQEICRVTFVTSSSMGNYRSPGSQHNLWRHHNLRCSEAGNSELEIVIWPEE